MRDLDVAEAQDGALIEDRFDKAPRINHTYDAMPSHGMFYFTGIDLEPGQAIMKSLQSPRNVRLENLLVARSEGIVIESIKVAEFEVLGLSVRADLLRGHILDANLRVGDSLTIVARNVDAVPRNFRPVVFYMVLR